MKYMAALLLLSLVACSSPSTKPCIQYIECPGGAADCQMQAREQCPKGFNPVNEAELGEGFSAFALQHFPGAASGVPHIVVTCAE